MDYKKWASGIALLGSLALAPSLHAQSRNSYDHSYNDRSYRSEQSSESSRRNIIIFHEGKYYRVELPRTVIFPDRTVHYSRNGRNTRIYPDGVHPVNELPRIGFYRDTVGNWHLSKTDRDGTTNTNLNHAVEGAVREAERFFDNLRRGRVNVP